MTETEIRQTICRLLKHVAPDTEPEKLNQEDDIRRTLGIDSFDALQFIVALDEQFGIETPEADYGKITTMKDLVNYIVKKTK